MNLQTLFRAVLWLVIVLALFGGIGVYRFYRTTPELRFPQTEALWQLLPFGLLLLITSALLLVSKNMPPTGTSKTDQPY